MPKNIVFTADTTVNGVDYSKGDEISASLGLSDKLIADKVAKEKVKEEPKKKPKKGK